MRNFKYLIFICMASVSLLNIAMLFTYRLIEAGPFLVPGGIVVFPFTYIFADIIAEVYGYKNAKILIWGNFICIFVFNLTAKLLLLFPASTFDIHENTYHLVFSHSFPIIIGYSVGFALGDFFNAYAVSKLGSILRGKHFAIRSIASSAVGQIIFSVVVSSIIYSFQLTGLTLLEQFLSTVMLKIFIVMLLAYPSAVIVVLLRKLEGIDEKNKHFRVDPFTEM